MCWTNRQRSQLLSQASQALTVVIGDPLYLQNTEPLFLLCSGRFVGTIDIEPYPKALQSLRLRSSPVCEAEQLPQTSGKGERSFV